MSEGIRERRNPEKEEGAGLRLEKKLQTMANIVQQETEHWLLQFNRENLKELKDINAVVVVGPSGAGKSTLVDVVRDWINENSLSETFAVPRRIVSRPQRENDNLIENDFASTPEEFDKKTQGGIRWQRKMDLKEDGRIEQYGFEPVPEGVIPIYSANLAFLSENSGLEGMDPDFRNKSLIVYVNALSHIRYDRLVERSPDIMTAKPEEAEMRLAGDKERVANQAHLTLRTRNRPKERELMSDAMRDIMQAVVETRE